MVFLFMTWFLVRCIDACIAILIVRAILDWVAILLPRWVPKGIVRICINAIYQTTNPPIRWVNRLIPPLPVGNAFALDLGFLVLFIGLEVLRQIIPMLLWII